MRGTSYYLSPEIVLNKPFKSDIWSLGVLLYEMMYLKMTLKIMKGFFSPPKIYSNDLFIFKC